MFLLTPSGRCFYAGNQAQTFPARRKSLHFQPRATIETTRVYIQGTNVLATKRFLHSLYCRSCLPADQAPPKKLGHTVTRTNQVHSMTRCLSLIAGLLAVGVAAAAPFHNDGRGVLGRKSELEDHISEPSTHATMAVRPFFFGDRRFRAI